MRAVSLHRLREATERAWRRFPLVLLAAVLAAVFGIILVDRNDDHPWAALMMTAQLGIPLFLALGLASSRRDHPLLGRGAWLALHLVGLAGLVAFYLTRSEQLGDLDLILFMQLNVGLHLLVAVLPFAGRGEIRGLWQFNVTLLLRFITAAFFSLVLFAGLSLALAALDMLFGVDLDDEIYLQLWIVIAFGFNTAYVLGGIPERLADLDGAETYPRVLRVFAQFILAPLVTVYLAILTAYLVKVVTTGEWPSGWIGWLVSSVAAAGILSLLLLKPEADRDDRPWLRWYARAYHWLMVPAVVMLALAVAKRVGQYGVTEPRYLMIVLTAWLAAVVAVGCRRRRLLLKAIPASLAVIAFVTALGPWSAASVSYHSQRSRLVGMLTQHARLADGVLVGNDAEVAPRQGAEIRELLRYLFDRHGTDALGDLADPELQARLEAEQADHAHRRAAASALTTVVLDHLNLPDVPVPPPGLAQHRSFLRQLADAAVMVGDHDHLVTIGRDISRGEPFDLAGETARFDIDWPGERLTLTRDDALLFSVSLSPMIDRLRQRHTRQPETILPGDDLSLPIAGPGARGVLRVAHIWWNEDDDGQIEDGDLTASLLLTLAPDPVEMRE